MISTLTTRRAFLLSASALALNACSTPGKITRVYTGPKADGIVVSKSERKLFVLKGNKPLSTHEIDLGFQPSGHKLKEGDGRTPEGQYFINRRNFNSAYFLSLGISYPNRRDVARARARGVRPGGDIFIHGGPRYAGEHGKPDWTAGCISVTDVEMENDLSDGSRRHSYLDKGLEPKSGPDTTGAPNNSTHHNFPVGS